MIPKAQLKSTLESFQASQWMDKITVKKGQASEILSMFNSNNDQVPVEVLAEFAYNETKGDNIINNLS
jgi:hypothetical protein